MASESEKKLNLRIPGPVSLPDSIYRALQRPIINHRGPVFGELLTSLTENLKTCLKTKNEVYFVTSSGTGVMELAVVNTLSPADEVLCVTVGWFGDRFGQIAEQYGANVTTLRYEAGQAADPDDVAAELKKMKNCKAVLVTHNESSTGVANPLQKICEVVKKHSDALLLVDAVSSAGGIALETDAWGIDILVTASQKAWYAPAGIGMIAISPKAWKAYESSTMPKYYFDVGSYRKSFKTGEPPFTPCITSMFALDSSLSEIAEAGVEQAVARHTEIADKVRHGVKSIGLELLVTTPEFASNTVTAVKFPPRVDGAKFLQSAMDQYGVEFGGGPGVLKDKVFRIGHLGWLEVEQIEEALEVVARLTHAK